MSLLLALFLAGQADPVIPRPDATDEAIARGVAYLVVQQDKEGGITGTRTHNQVAMTSLAILAMTAVGHQPTDETKEGQALRAALAYVVKPERQDPQGYFGSKDGSRMYGHGIVTLMLAETTGMGLDAAQDQAIRERCRKAVDLIVRSQSREKDERHRGGWRYEPGSTDADLSVSAWQVMALRAAKNAGYEVPKEAIDGAVAYFQRCYASPRGPDGKPLDLKSACGYEPGRRPEFAMASAGLLSLQVSGQYESPEVKGSADWLREQKVRYESEWFFYGAYYYAQGMYQRGGEWAAEARKKIEEALLPKQGTDGSWAAVEGQEKGAGKVYSTALAILCLAVKHHALPIYQR